MKMFLRNVLTTAVIGGCIFLVSCKDDVELPDNLVTFESSELGITDQETALEITIQFSRAVAEAGSLAINIEENGLGYGSDYTTLPVASANQITIPVASGSSSVTFTVVKSEDALYDGDETLVFTISTVPASLVLGNRPELTLSFAEIIAATGEMEINGGGATFPNKVFIDLSANRQTAVARTTWDLGFYTGDDFRVILNSSNTMLVYALDKTDLNAVTNTDTAVLRNRLSSEAIFAAITSPPAPEWVADAINWIDDPAGDLTKTAIAQVSATASENKVYIVNRGTGPGTPGAALGWKKIRVIRNGNGYTLQHADINATTFSEIQIQKNSAYEFQYVSFASGAVVVEPERTRWDIAWTGFNNSTNFGTGPIPYYFQDIILQNRVGVQTVQVLTATKSYETFAEADLDGLDFGVQTQIKIGADWRSGGGPGTPPAVRTDRFYVIKDADGNYYKLKFTALTTDGERGRPVIEYKLVKQGS
ncbi:MAG: HmuY family protein [Cyclobacteriaceae bacterium]|nr:HmuY family protein [Cyclobacteriaceae bacterium]